MPRTPQRAGWWRFPAPSVLVFTLILGILPWIEVGCEGKPEDFKNAGNAPGQKSSRQIGQNGKVVLYTQNGYQSIWAGVSLGSDMKEIQQEFEDDVKKSGGKVTKTEKKEKDPNEPSAAPLVAIYFVFVLGAVVVGFVMPPGRWRSITFLGTAGLAVLLLAIQTAVGFPLKNKAEEKPNAKGGGLNLGMGDFDAQKNATGPKPYCRYTIWYYLNWPFLLIPLGLVGTEEVIGLMGGGGKKKSKQRYDDDEDDRPRRRSRHDDEEDEDDRPRKRSRPRDEEDEEEDDRPRKRRRPDDEDDEDDQRIKKRR